MFLVLDRMSLYSLFFLGRGIISYLINVSEHLTVVNRLEIHKKISTKSKVALYVRTTKNPLKVQRFLEFRNVI